MKKLDIIADKCFIGGWFIDTKVCDSLIDYFENSSDRNPGVVSTSSIVDKQHKDSIDMGLDPHVPLVKKYADELNQVVTEYIKLYPDCCNSTSPWCIYSAHIQKYNPKGGYYSWHTERTSGEIPNASRHLVFMTYLNDILQGGETEFRNQKLKIKPQKGLTLLWPVDWTHTHRGIPAPIEAKYIVTGWFNFI